MRRLGLALTAAAFCAFAVPAVAGPTEIAFLGTFAGSWSGVGTVTGAKNGPVDCTMTLTPTSKGLSFTGNCTATNLGPPQRISGAVVYDDAAKRYLGTGGGQTVVATKSGSALLLTTKLRGMIGTGTSTLRLTASKITIDATIEAADSSGQYLSHIVLAKG